MFENFDITWLPVSTLNTQDFYFSSSPCCSSSSWCKSEPGSSSCHPFHWKSLEQPSCVCTSSHPSLCLLSIHTISHALPNPPPPRLFTFPILAFIPPNRNIPFIFRFSNLALNTQNLLISVSISFSNCSLGHVHRDHCIPLISQLFCSQSSFVVLPTDH